MKKNYNEHLEEKESGNSHEFNTRIPPSYYSINSGKKLPCSSEMIKIYTNDPMFYNKEIRELAWWAYNSNGVITNTIDYMCAMPTLNSKIVFTKDKQKSNFQKLKKRFESALSSIRDSEIIRDSIRKNCNDGVSFYYLITDEQSASNNKYMSSNQVDSIIELNETKVKCSLFALPVDYCKIVGIINSSYVLAFDLNFFDEIDNKEKKLKSYPKEIREAYLNRTEKNNNWYVLNNNNTVVTKVRAKREEPWGRPIALSAFDNIMYSDYFIDTKRNTLDEINNKLIYQTFPEGKEKGTSALTSTQQQEQHNTVKSALSNRKQGQFGLAFVSLAADTKLSLLDVQTDIFNDNTESNLQDKIAGDVGFAASLLNGASKGNYSTQMTNLELVSSEIFEWIKQFQTELNKVLNANIIKDLTCFIEVDYLPITFVNKEKMITCAKELYMNGKGSLQAWISACGFNFDSYLAMLDEEMEEDYENKYPVHKTSYTLSGNDLEPSDIDKSTGRPNKNDSTNENTVKSKTTASNNQPKPKVGK